MSSPRHAGDRGATGPVPVLGLLVKDGPPELRALLVAMRSRCQPRYAGRGGVSTAAAYLVLGSAERPPSDAPVALWVPAGTRPDATFGGAVRVLLTADLGTALAWEAAQETASAPTSDAVPAVEAVLRAVVDAAPVPPFVRRRLRDARHLAADGVAAYEDGAWSWGFPALPVPDDLADTLCASAAAVAATTPTTALRALAWGAPLVTDAVTAAAIGAVAGVHCLVATDRGGRSRAAGELAADERLAARIGWQGRLHFERWHDLTRVADRVADRLDLPRAPGTRPVDAVLAALGTPATSHVRDRASRATATLTHHGEGALVP